MKTKSFVNVLPGPQQTPWHRIEHRDSFNVGAYVDLSDASDVNYGIDIGFSDSNHDVINGVNITRSGTTATINTNSSFFRLAKSGDSVVVVGCGAPFDGTYQLSVTTGIVTYTVANSGATQSNLGNGATATLIRTFAFNTGLLVSGAYSIQVPCDFVRLNIASSTVGQATVTFTQGND